MANQNHYPGNHWNTPTEQFCSIQHSNPIQTSSKFCEAIVNHTPKLRETSKSSCIPKISSSTITKHKIRRHKANARERNRMHGLNDALNRLRKCIPIHSKQCISKIETIRMAKNYIEAMGEMLGQNFPLDDMKFGKILTKGLSQGTTSVIAGFLNLNPKSICSSSSSHQSGTGFPKSMQMQQQLAQQASNSTFGTNGLLTDYSEVAMSRSQLQSHQTAKNPPTQQSEYQYFGNW